MSFWSKVEDLDRLIFSRVNGKWHNSFLDVFLAFTRQMHIWIPFYFFLIAFTWLNFRLRGLYWAFFFTHWVADRFHAVALFRLRHARVTQAGSRAKGSRALRVTIRRANVVPKS